MPRECIDSGFYGFFIRLNIMHKTEWPLGIALSMQHYLIGSVPVSRQYIMIALYQIYLQVGEVCSPFTK